MSLRFRNALLHSSRAARASTIAAPEAPKPVKKRPSAPAELEARRIERAERRQAARAVKRAAQEREAAEQARTRQEIVDDDSRLQKASSRGSVIGVMQVLASFKASGRSILREHYNLLLRALATHELADEALMVLDGMRSAGVQPYAEAYNLAFKVSRRPRSPSLTTAGSLCVWTRCRADNSAHAGRGRSTKCNRLAVQDTAVSAIRGSRTGVHAGETV